MNIYDGIGSGKMPVQMLKRMEEVGKVLAERDWILRSGGSVGADQAVQKGANSVDPEKVELYLPWRGYEKEAADQGNVISGEPSQNAYEIAAGYHPAWSRCGRGARALHARNVEIILGSDLNRPVSLVICWTPDGKMKGGTAMGIRLAQAKDIPVVNLAASQGMEFVKRLLAGDSVKNCVSLFFSISFQRRLFE